MFKIITLNGMILIIPLKFVEDLRSLPDHCLSARQFQVYVRLLFDFRRFQHVRRTDTLQSLYGKATTVDILLKSDLHARMLKHRVSPNLPAFVPGTLEEIEFALEKEFPRKNGIGPLPKNR